MNKYILFDVLDGVGGHEHGNTCGGGPDVSSPSCPLYRMDLQAAWHCSINLCLKSSVCLQCSMLTGISLSLHVQAGTHKNPHMLACSSICVSIALVHAHTHTHTHTQISLAVLSFTRSFVNTRALVSHHNIKPNIRLLSLKEQYLSVHCNEIYL